MRRKDREITAPEKISDMISRCNCCRIGFYDDGEVYIIPLNFGYIIKDDHLPTFYFHGANKGRKIDLIAKNNKVGFEMDTDSAVYSIGRADIACDYTSRFQSIIGNGIVSIVSGSEEKKLGLSLLMEHNTGKSGWSFDGKALDAVTVFKLEASKLSCKEHL